MTFFQTNINKFFTSLAVASFSQLSFLLTMETTTNNFIIKSCILSEQYFKYRVVYEPLHEETFKSR